MRIGVNTFGLGSILSTGDRGERLDLIKKAGADSLEVCIVCVTVPKVLNDLGGSKTGGMFPIDRAPAMIEEVRSHGLGVVGAHIMAVDFTGKKAKANVDALIRLAHQCGLKYYVLSLNQSQTAALEPYIPGLNYAVTRFATEGIDLLYHNHEAEWKPDQTGVTALDYLMQEVPGMLLELDVGWAMYAGLDTVETMRKYAERIRIIHFKDIAAGAGENRKDLHFTAIGEGALPLAEIVNAAPALSLYEQGFVVDQDSSETDMLMDLAASIRNIRAGKTVSVGRAIAGDPLRLSVWSCPALFGKRPASFRNLLMAARRAGVDHVDLMSAEVALYGLGTVEQILNFTGTKVNCFITSLPMGSCKPARVEKQVRKDLDAAARLGADKLMIVASGVRCTGDPDQRKKAADTMAAVLNIAVQTAEGTGITVCIEDTPSCHVPLSTAAECAYVLAQVPGLKLVFDTANMIPGGDSDPMAFYEALKDSICHVHLKDIAYTDKKRADPCSDGRKITCVNTGKGIIPVRAIMERMIADGYTGSAMLEYTVPPAHTYMGHRKNLNSFIRALFG